MTDRRRTRKPSKDELDLWAVATRHDKPLRPVQPDREAPQTALPASGGVSAFNGAAASLKAAPADDAQALPAQGAKATRRGPPPLAGFETRRAKMLAREQLAIDARLDLHGMRQADAHAALRRFLRHCQNAGHRHVLVITGKGARGGHGEGDLPWGEERGVLRRIVPQWLGDEECRRYVVSFTEASMKHGGSGALYLTLRKSRPR